MALDKFNYENIIKLYDLVSSDNDQQWRKLKSHLNAISILICDKMHLESHYFDLQLELLHVDAFNGFRNPHER